MAEESAPIPAGPFSINPGSGPVWAGTETDAWINMVRLCDDAGVLDQLDMPDAIQRLASADGDDSRMAYLVRLGDRAVQVDMPALPLLLVRFTGEGDQDAWQFPRLYVEGSSWLWKSAANMLAGHLLDDE